MMTKRHINLYIPSRWDSRSNENQACLETLSGLFRPPIYVIFTKSQREFWVHVCTQMVMRNFQGIFEMHVSAHLHCGGWPVPPAVSYSVWHGRLAAYIDKALSGFRVVFRSICYQIYLFIWETSSILSKRGAEAGEMITSGQTWLRL